MTRFSLPLRPLFHDILDFVYPPVCLSCNNTLGKKDRYLCPACWSSIPVLSEQDDLLTETRQKLHSSGIIAGLTSHYVFEEKGVFRALAHALKYQGFRSVGIMLGEHLGRRVLEMQERLDLLIPIPLHKAKLRERGFNQSLEICNGIAAVTGVAVRPDVLKRVRNTPSQTHLKLEERAKNVMEAFAVPKQRESDLEGKTCLLVDDVITTGSTIISGGEALLNSGVRSVHAASVALAERATNP